MAKPTMKKMGKEIGPASVYAKPHTASGGSNIDLGNNGYPNNIANTQTEKMRGTGAAIKGTGHSKKMG
jgi:hypothetical protein